MQRRELARCQVAPAARGLRSAAYASGVLPLTIQAASCLLFVVVFASLVGCGTGDPLRRQALSGTVTLDGAAVERGTISFDPESLEAVTSSGAVIEDGEFSIPREAGLPPGSYRVRINIPKPGADVPEDNMTLPGEESPAPAELAPPEWNSRSTQTIEITNEGPFVFLFEI